jgi:hypothetical protein
VDAVNVEGKGPVFTAGDRDQGVGNRELVGGLVKAIGSFGMMRVGLRGSF